MLEIAAQLLGLDIPQTSNADFLPEGSPLLGPRRLHLLPPVADLLSPVQVILIIKYWTLLCVVSILLSLGSYVIMTSLTQSLWLYKISPKTFPFLCELPLCVCGGVAWAGGCGLSESRRHLQEGSWQGRPVTVGRGGGWCSPALGLLSSQLLITM